MAVERELAGKSIKENDPEVKKAKAFTVNATRIGELDKIFTRFSSRYRLKRFVAWMLRYRRALHKACKKDSSKEREAKRRPIQHLTVEELHEAELEIVKIVQERSFREEIAAISQNLKSSCNANVAPNPIKRSSHLYKLDPVYDKRVLRVGGRLRNSSVPEVAKHPLILPRNHHVVTLIIEFYHDLSGHCGLEHVLAMLRERFWIIRARVLTKSVLNRCFSCKKRQAPVGAQKMADLPADRVTAGKPPFTSVGVDCFGPFFVKNGRSNAKRYGVLFTCLTIRAVHIEVVSSLDTDSFLNALRRFVARRGQPEEIRSDNGTNFVGANHELRKAIKAWNQDKINEFLVQRNVRWTFNPPKASHHGGAWERCIRTVRKVLNALTNEQVLDDERLTTLMCEVEAIVNNRPITKVSDDPKDLEAPLTTSYYSERDSSVHPLFFRVTTSTCVASGDRCNISQTSFGSVGRKNIFRVCSNGKNGPRSKETSLSGILCSWLMKMHLEIRGRWVESSKSGVTVRMVSCEAWW